MNSGFYHLCDASASTLKQPKSWFSVPPPIFSFIWKYGSGTFSLKTVQVWFLFCLGMQRTSSLSHLLLNSPLEKAKFGNSKH